MSSSTHLHNVVSMGTGEVVRRLTDLYEHALERGMAIQDLPSVMLWGPPGVGKSQAVHQIAGAIGRDRGLNVVVHDVRLILFNSIDLRGIPVPDATRTEALWLRPQVFAMDGGADVLNILFLDEITAAAPSVQAAAFQITLDHTCGEHRLPDNCIVICAGNRTSDRSGAYRMPRALANRLMHIEVHADIDSWHDWAHDSSLNEKVIGYLGFRPDRLTTYDADTDDLAFATPRSWEYASRIIDALNGDTEAARPLLAAAIGSGEAAEFCAWARVFSELPDLDGIFSGREHTVPKSPDALYALVSAIVARARTCTDDLEAISRSIDYARKLPPDFSTLLIKDYLTLRPNYRSTLMTLPSFARWLANTGATLDAAF